MANVKVSPAPLLSSEFVGLLRCAQADMRIDVVASATGIAELLRLIAASLDDARHQDLDMLVCCGMALERLGANLRDEALAVHP